MHQAQCVDMRELLAGLLFNVTPRIISRLTFYCYPQGYCLLGGCSLQYCPGLFVRKGMQLIVLPKTRGNFAVGRSL